ncbi:hypothetical protein SK3146_00229 [Paenibacillus konkukensis]|uniref:Thiazole-containing bacteriocin maturation protein n=1 Tax=Paenibacillus konkukensis TaxID=2020716 RepID=A0ABY4RHR5_9BACL|nr:hypothetical protein [Paenibacillus konkukensis]UQZ81073.1 hypothetical protein SK3146_00229 [Paenibacillus konkukensis]
MSSQGEGVLAVGSGTILIELVKAWYESRLSKLSVLAVNMSRAEAEQLKEASEQALTGNPETSPNIILAEAEGVEVNWAAAIRPFSFILYAAEHNDLEELEKLQTACTAEKKPLLPATNLRGIGMAGPLLHPDGEGGGQSAWRRIHASVFPPGWETYPLYRTTATLLSNLVVYEYHKRLAGEGEPNRNNHCYILNPLTLEGSWHQVLPHPSLSARKAVVMTTELERNLESDQEPDVEQWFSWFEGLTSKVSGIFHVWEEGALKQLPLAQCLVQPVDPLSEGFAQLLPAIICSALTHVEARRESGLAGVEAYAARMTPLWIPRLSSSQEDIGIGAGLTFAEAVGRGLVACLTQELERRTLHHERVLTRMEIGRIEDTHCRYYLQALNIQEGEILVASEEPLLGFPVVWVLSDQSWYGAVGLDITLALRRSLQNALMKTESAAVRSVAWSDDKPQRIAVFPAASIGHAARMLSAIKTLKQHHKRLEVFDMRCEPFLKEGLLEVVGVLLGEEESL